MGQTPPGQKQALCTAVGRQGAWGLVGGEGGGGLGRDGNPGTNKKGRLCLWPVSRGQRAAVLCPRPREDVVRAGGALSGR